MSPSTAYKTGLAVVAGLWCLPVGTSHLSEAVLDLSSTWPVCLMLSVAGLAAVVLAGLSGSASGANFLYSGARLPPKVIRPGEAARRQQQLARQEKLASRAASRSAAPEPADDEDVSWSELDLGRLTLAGWMLFLSTLGVLVVFIAAVPRELGREVGGRGVGLIGFLVLGAWFGGGRLLMRLVGLRMMRPK